jgi:phosphatidylserine/phosphatidylglycerophosphate/cardiolipin synthase-like enzyme
MNNAKGELSFGCKKLQLLTTRQAVMKLLYEGAKDGHDLRIITYSLPKAKQGIDYIYGFLSRPKPPRVRIIAHSKFEKQAREINSEFSENVQIRIQEAVHSKVLLIAPDIVVVGSANFGDGDWHETSVLIESSQAYEWYFRHEWNKMWKTAEDFDKPIRPRGFNIPGG